MGNRIDKTLHAVKRLVALERISTQPIEFLDGNKPLSRAQYTLLASGDKVLLVLVKR
jgi:hypothetical protein